MKAARTPSRRVLRVESAPRLGLVSAVSHLMILGRLAAPLSWLGQPTGVAGTSLAASQAEVASVAYSWRGGRERDGGVRALHIQRPSNSSRSFGLITSLVAQSQIMGAPRRTERETHTEREK